MLTVDQLEAPTGTVGPPDGRPHAVVIGSGFGGLAAAIRLGARGYRVTVLEKLDRPGGRAYVHRQDGFCFDAGPTIVTGPFLLEELWALCGRRMAEDIDLRPLDPFYRIRFHDGEEFAYSGDPAAMRAEVARFNPADVAGYDRFMAQCERVYRIGFETLGALPFDKWTDMARAMPDLMRAGGYRTVYGMVSRFLKHPRLRIVFSFHPLLIGGNPCTTTSIYTLINFLERAWGVHFPMGGTGALVTGLARLIAGQGNRLRCNAEVAEILVENGRAVGVRLANGDRIPAAIVVSNADAAWTYARLMPGARRRRWSDRRIRRAAYSNGLFVWYFGTNRRYPDVSHHMMLLGPRYRGLLRDIFRRKHLADDVSLYLHRPTATDPSLAPPGCDAFYALAPVPHLDSGTDWPAIADSFRRRIARVLSDSVLPGLEDAVVTSRITTPQEFHDRLHAMRGAAFGFEPLMTQSAWFRPHNRSEDVDNLFLVGAGTHPGAGIPGVLTSAKILDSVVPHAAAFR